jgi:hypothetical protein
VAWSSSESCKSESLRHLVALLGRQIGPSQRLYQHRTTRKTWTLVTSSFRVGLNPRSKTAVSYNFWVVPVLNLTPRREDAWHILNFGRRLRWVVSFTTRPLYSWGNNPGIHWIRGWVALRVGLEAVAKWKIPVSAGNRTLVVHPVA